MTTVEGCEARAVLFGGRGDQGVREAAVEASFLILLDGRNT
jgi:hypothetical protein